MKRLIFCGCFFALLAVLSLASGFFVEQYVATVSASLEAASTAAQQERPEVSIEELKLCIAYSREKEHTLALLLHRETLVQLDAVLNAALEYAKSGSITETLAELARAKSQLYGLQHLFSQLL